VSNPPAPQEDLVQRLFDDLSSWKTSLEDLGTSYDPFRSDIDALHVRLDSFLTHARMTAKKGATLSDDVVDLLETLSSNERPTTQTKERVTRRVEKLKNSCQDMIQECQTCKDNFLQIYGRFSDLLDDLEERDAQLEKEIKSTKCKASRARAIAKVATSVGLVASAAAALTTFFFSMGASAFVVAPIAVSVATPILAFYSSSRSAASTKQIEKRGHEINLLREIIDGMSTGTDKITEMTRWWHSVQEEIASLEACFTKPQWGSSAKLVYSMEDWRALEDRFNEYAEQLSKVSTNLERKLRTPSPTLVGSTTSTSSNRSSHRKVESDSVRVRRVGDTTKLSQPRRAIAVVNSSSLRAP